MAFRLFLLLHLLLAATVAQEQMPFNGRTAREWLDAMKQATTEHERDHAQWALGVMHERAFRSVIGALADADADIRRRALELAVDFGPGVACGVEQIRGLTADPDPRVQVQARAALLSVTASRNELPRLLAALESQERPVCMAAARAIAGLGADAAPAVPALAELLGRSDRFYEAVKVVRLDREHAGTVARGVHLEVVRALQALGPVAAPAAPALAASLEHPSALVRDAALEALGAIGAGAALAIPALIAQLTANDWGTRRDAAINLSKIAAAAGGAQDTVVAALVGRLTDPVTHVRGAACHSLARLGRHARSATGALVQLLQDDDRRSAQAQEAAIECLGAIGPEAKDAVPVLKEIATADSKRSYDAVRALAAIAPEAAKDVPALAQHLKELEERRLPAPVQRDLAIRRALEQLTGADADARTGAVVELGQRFAREATPTLLKMLDQQPERDLKRALVGVLGDLGARATAARIRPLLDDPEVQDLAAFTLARFADPPSLPRLLELVKNPAEPSRAMLAAVLAAGGVADVVPALLEMGEGEGPAQYLGPLGVHLLRDPRLAAGLRHKLAALAEDQEVPAEDRADRRGALLAEMAWLDPHGHRDLLLAHLDDPDLTALRPALAAGLARLLEPRALPILLAAQDHDELSRWLAPELTTRLDALWLWAEEWEHVPVRKVAETVARKLDVPVEFSSAIPPEWLQERRDQGEAYEFYPRGLNLRAWLWLALLASPSRASPARLAWILTRDRLRIVTVDEAAAFWKSEAPRLLPQSAPASRPR